MSILNFIFTYFTPHTLIRLILLITIPISALIFNLDIYSKCSDQYINTTVACIVLFCVGLAIWRSQVNGISLKNGVSRRKMCKRDVKYGLLSMLCLELAALIIGMCTAIQSVYAPLIMYSLTAFSFMVYIFFVTPNRQKCEIDERNYWKYMWKVLCVYSCPVSRCAIGYERELSNQVSIIGLAFILLIVPIFTEVYIIRESGIIVRRGFFEENPVEDDKRSKILQCGACSTHYSNKLFSTIPRVLKCGHTVCQGCARKNHKEKDDNPKTWLVKCPLCQKTERKDSILDLPRNLAIVDYIRELDL